jgi:DNA-binding NtrC family response regulator
MSQHNPDTAAYEKAIRDLRYRLQDCRQLVQDYLTEHAQLVKHPWIVLNHKRYPFMIEHNPPYAVRCLCGLCDRARTMLEKG